MINTRIHLFDFKILTNRSHVRKNVKFVSQKSSRSLRDVRNRETNVSRPLHLEIRRVRYDAFFSRSCAMPGVSVNVLLPEKYQVNKPRL